MGTRTIDDVHLDEELGLRRRLVAEAHDEVVATVAGSGPARREAAAVVSDWLARHRPGRAVTQDPDSSNPLVAVGLTVQEDLCLMESVDGEWRFTAGLLCFPSYWRLGDKIDRTQGQVHGPVPHYSDELETRVSRFFDRLKPDRIVARPPAAVRTRRRAPADPQGRPSGPALAPQRAPDAASPSRHRRYSVHHPSPARPGRRSRRPAAAGRRPARGAGGLEPGSAGEPGWASRSPRPDSGLADRGRRPQSCHCRRAIGLTAGPSGSETAGGT